MTWAVSRAVTRAMNQAVVRVLLALALATTAAAAPAEDGDDARWAVAVDYGETTQTPERGFTRFDVYRLTLRRYWGKALWTGEHMRLGGFWEASANYWDADDGDLWAAAFSPVFALYFGNAGRRWQPYIEGGIGAAFLSETSLAGRGFSTTFQFENRLGIGIRGERWDFHARYLHYSNADIDKPNNGMDSFGVGVAYRF